MKKLITLIVFMAVGIVSYGQYNFMWANDLLVKNKFWMVRTASNDTLSIYQTSSTNYINSTNPITLNNNFTILNGKSLTVGTGTITNIIDVSTTKVPQIKVDSLNGLGNNCKRLWVDSIMTKGILRIFTGTALTKILETSATTLSLNLPTAIGTSASGYNVLNATVGGSATGINVQHMTSSNNSISANSCYSVLSYNANALSGFGGYSTFNGSNTITSNVMYVKQFWRLRNAGASFYTQNIWMTNNAGIVDTSYVFDKNGAYITNNKTWSFLVSDSAEYINGLANKRGKIAMADDAAIILPSGKSGWGTIIIDSAGVTTLYKIDFTFDNDGIINTGYTQLKQTWLADIALNNTTDGTLCLFPTSTGLTIRQRLGGNRNVKYNIYY